MMTNKRIQAKRMALSRGGYVGREVEGDTADEAYINDLFDQKLAGLSEQPQSVNNKLSDKALGEAMKRIEELKRKAAQ